MRATAPQISPAMRSRPGGEAGFALIEVLVSSLVIVLIAVGAFAALEAAGRTSAEERHRAQAHGIAQEDQARLRSRRISDLANLVETRTVIEDGTTYTITSRGDYVNDTTGTASCTQGANSADYISIKSTVSWPSQGARPPVALQSVVAPPNSATSATNGALAIAATNAANQPLPGVSFTGTGPDSFSGTTGANGCAIFGYLPQGNYTLTPSAPGKVNKDGVAPGPQTVSVVGSSTNTVALQYDTPGSLNVSFTTRATSNGAIVPSSADQVVVFNTGMTSAKTFGTLGAPASTVTATPLFPFASPDTVYAGSCTGNNPNPFGQTPPPVPAALASVVIPAGGTATASIQLPALYLTVMSGTSSSSPGVPVNNARVRISDNFCSSGGSPIRRTFFTNSSGQLPNPGLPYGWYDVCAEGGGKRATASFVGVTSTTTGTSRTLYTGGGTTGTCA